MNDPETIANEFNTYFPSTTKYFEKKLVKAKSDFLRYLKEYNQQSSFISLAGSSEVLSEINSYKLNNSFGILGLSSKISQLFHDAISEQVTLIANLSFAA